MIGPAECGQVQGAGQDSPPTSQSVAGPAHHSARPVSGAEGGVRASQKSVQAWEAAYRRYGQIWELGVRAPKDDPAAAREMAAASWAVAAAWRQIAAATSLPWWTLVAIEVAAAAFEAQAREYKEQEENERGHEG